MISKLQVFLMIPTLFMGTVPALYNALSKLVYGLVLLFGRVITERFRRDYGYQTCFNHVFLHDLEQSKVIVPEAMSEFAQATPPSSHKSHAHHILHYPKCVEYMGNLTGQWMFGDERRNKTVKDMAKQRKHCEASIARVYSEHLVATNPLHSPPPISLDTCCIDTARTTKMYVDTDEHVSILLRGLTRQEYNGMCIDVELWTVHKRAKISGVGFTAGQPMTGVRKLHEKMNRCSSVVTLVRGGRSLYAWVIRFLSYDKLHVAHVRWLPEPEYPIGTPVLVRLNRDTPPPIEPSIISLTDIDPSRVAILHEGTCIYMMRLNGIDTMPT